MKGRLCMNNQEIIKDTDEIITDVVNGLLVDYEAKKGVKRNLIRLMSLVSKQYKNNPEFRKMFDNYYENSKK